MCIHGDIHSDNIPREERPQVRNAVAHLIKPTQQGFIAKPFIDNVQTGTGMVLTTSIDAVGSFYPVQYIVLQAVLRFRTFSHKS